MEARAFICNLSFLFFSFLLCEENLCNHSLGWSPPQLRRQKTKLIFQPRRSRAGKHTLTTHLTTTTCMTEAHKHQRSRYKRTTHKQGPSLFELEGDRGEIEAGDRRPGRRGGGGGRGEDPPRTLHIGLYAKQKHGTGVRYERPMRSACLERNDGNIFILQRFISFPGSPPPSPRGVVGTHGPRSPFTTSFRHGLYLSSYSWKAHWFLCYQLSKYVECVGSGGNGQVDQNFKHSNTRKTN